MNDLLLSANMLTTDSNNYIAITQPAGVNVQLALTTAFWTEVNSRINSATIDLNGYTGTVAFTGNIFTWKGNTVATTNQLPGNATTSTPGLVKPLEWSASVKNGLTYDAPTGQLRLPASAVTAVTPSGVVSASISANTLTVGVTAATAAEVKTGTDNNKVVTPSGFKNALTANLGWQIADGNIPSTVVRTSSIGQPNGIAPLGSNGKMSMVYIDSLLQGNVYGDVKVTAGAVPETYVYEFATYANGDDVNVMNTAVGKHIFITANNKYYRRKSSATTFAEAFVEVDAPGTVEIAPGDKIFTAAGSTSSGGAAIPVNTSYVKKSWGNSLADNFFKEITALDLATYTTPGVIAFDSQYFIISNGTVEVLQAGTDTLGVVKVPAQTYLELGTGGDIQFKIGTLVKAYSAASDNCVTGTIVDNELKLVVNTGSGLTKGNVISVDEDYVVNLKKESITCTFSTATTNANANTAILNTTTGMVYCRTVRKPTGVRVNVGGVYKYYNIAAHVADESTISATPLWTIDLSGVRTWTDTTNRVCYICFE